MTAIDPRATQYLKEFGANQVPMIGYCDPEVVELTASRCEIRIPLQDKTKNHLNSMYFGALAVGADVAGGLMAMQMIQASGQPIDLVFKDFKANFLRRPDADVHFNCEDGELVQAMIAKAMQSGERVNETVTVTATADGEPVAEMQLTLSLKKR